ncbi:MAG TPA: phosphatase PAP2 family protein [Thermoanaerobaculia bacterium]|nr:phosphatase PAP2 family protein [Thermoanaerobaculia bacterium]
MSYPIPFLLFLAFTSGVYLISRHLLPPLTGLLILLTRRTLGVILRTAFVSRLIMSSRERFSPLKAYAPVALVVASGMLVTFWAADIFFDLVELLHSSSGVLEEVDTTAHSWAKEYRSGPATLFFTLFTVVGGPSGLAVILLLTTLLLCWRRRFRWAAYLTITALGGGVLNLALKLHFARARPDLSIALRHAGGFSFPSGHAMGSMAVFAALAYIAIRAFPTPRERSASFAIAASVILTVGLSRIYLGVHWLSDIGAGFAAGGIWATFTTAAYESVRRIRAIRRRMGAEAIALDTGESSR